MQLVLSGNGQFVSHRLTEFNLPVKASFLPLFDIFSSYDGVHPCKFGAPDLIGRVRVYMGVVGIINQRLSFPSGPWNSCTKTLTK